MKIKIKKILSLLFSLLAIIMVLPAIADNISQAQVEIKKEISDSDADDKALSFFDAVKLNRVALVAARLQQGESVNALDRRGNTPLFYAAAKGHSELVSLLIANGATVEIIGFRSWTPLMIAAYHGHRANVQRLYNAGAALHSENSDGLTPLMAAITTQQQETVELLLSLGANVDQASTVGMPIGVTPLMQAAAKGDLSIIQRLLNAKAKLALKDANGRNAFFYAVRAQHSAVLDLLLASGEKIDQTNSFGETALHQLATKSNTNLLAHLLDLGANFRVRDQNGDTALSIASRAGNFPVIVLLAPKSERHEQEQALILAAANGSHESVEALLTLGISVNATTAAGRTALMEAAHQRHLKLLETLLSRGAEIDAIDSSGRTALMVAVATEPMRLEVIELLLAKGADIKKQDNEGNTALMLALTHPQQLLSFAVIKSLLAAGADVTAVNNQQLTALDLFVNAQRSTEKISAAQEAELVKIAQLFTRM